VRQPARVPSRRLVMSTVIHLVGLVATGAFLTVGLLFALLVFHLHSIRASSRRLAFVGVTRHLVSLFEGLLHRVLPRADVEDCHVRILNQYFEKTYKSTRIEERVVFLPGCLRHAQCPARLDPNLGLVCVSCGRCPIGAYLADMNKANAKAFVIPGGRFVERIVRAHNPKAILGVGCLSEIREGMQMADTIHVCPQSVKLDSDGCVNTSVDWGEVRRMSLAGGSQPQDKH
jgi:hypothetical protein